MPRRKKEETVENIVVEAVEAVTEAPAKKTRKPRAKKETAAPAEKHARPVLPAKKQSFRIL